MTLLTPVLCLLAGASPAPEAAVPPQQVAPHATPPRAEAKPYPRSELLVSLAPGLRPDSVTGGATGWVGFTYQLTPIFRLEVDVGLGAFPSTQDVLTPIRIGTHIEWPREGAIPYLWVALAHNHETKFDTVVRNPVPTILGLSEEGVVHRTGLDVGLGVFHDIPVIFPTLMSEAVHTRLGVRLSYAALLGSGPPRSVDLFASLGLLF